ncbi:hypothetical protein COLO4_10980 [Corchorus olitorius]|uniref:Uncharacterized protein n=1 Tax=Corchorus olitorius TaxID=93759 RepID=A0A1R3K6B8_9ROSI|nr:hypothetical protein COLO4_10980 [Corchorus olitorius]
MDTKSNATVPNVQVLWDLCRPKFGSRLEPDYGFCIAFMVDGETLLVGDSTKEGYARTRAHKPVRSQALLLRREQGAKFSTRKPNLEAKAGKFPSIVSKRGCKPLFQY